MDVLEHAALILPLVIKERFKDEEFANDISEIFKILRKYAHFKDSKGRLKHHSMSHSVANILINKISLKVEKKYRQKNSKNLLEKPF